MILDGESFLIWYAKNHKKDTPWFPAKKCCLFYKVSSLSFSHRQSIIIAAAFFLDIFFCLVLLDKMSDLNEILSSFQTKILQSMTEMQREMREEIKENLAMMEKSSSNYSSMEPSSDNMFSLKTSSPLTQKRSNNYCDDYSISSGSQKRQLLGPSIFDDSISCPIPESFEDKYQMVVSFTSNMRKADYIVRNKEIESIFPISWNIHKDVSLMENLKKVLYNPY